MYCKAVNVPNTDASAFNGVFFENIKLHVPGSAVNSYRSTWPWSNFKEIVSLDGGNPDPINVSFESGGIWYREPGKALPWTGSRAFSFS